MIAPAEAPKVLVAPQGSIGAEQAAQIEVIQDERTLETVGLQSSAQSDSPLFRAALGGSITNRVGGIRNGLAQYDIDDAADRIRPVGGSGRVEQEVEALDGGDGKRVQSE